MGSGPPLFCCSSAGVLQVLPSAWLVRPFRPGKAWCFGDGFRGMGRRGGDAVAIWGGAGAGMCLLQAPGAVVGSGRRARPFVSASCCLRGCQGGCGGGCRRVPAGSAAQGPCPLNDVELWRVRDEKGSRLRAVDVFARVVGAGQVVCLFPRDPIGVVPGYGDGVFVTRASDDA